MPYAKHTPCGFARAVDFWERAGRILRSLPLPGPNQGLFHNPWRCAGCLELCGREQLAGRIRQSLRQSLRQSSRQSWEGLADGHAEEEFDVALGFLKLAKEQFHGLDWGHAGEGAAENDHFLVLLR